MEAKTKVRLESLGPYYALFPAAEGIDKTVKMGATVADTVALIPKVIRSTTWQVDCFVKQELSSLKPYEACEKLWYWVKHHILYEPDLRGLEMVRSARRLIKDGKGDCDCGSTFIGTCILSLSKMVDGFRSITLRITKYKKDYFQHIYPVITLTNGTKIIMDFVVDKFNYEEPYSEKKDYKMELQYLDGIDETSAPVLEVNADNLLGVDNSLAELGKLLKKNKGGSASQAEKNQAKKEKHKKNGKKLLKAAHALNKFNVGTATIRAGILASMKMNVGKVAETLRWAYASRELAQSKGMDMGKYDKLQAVLQKAEKIFYGAGGKIENLKKVILTGRGNRDHAVAGLDAYNDKMALSTLLGAIYQDEFTNGINGYEHQANIEGLGVVAASASIAAASSAIGALAALIKNIGTLFPHKKKDADSAASNEPSGDDGNGTTIPDPGPRPEPQEDSPEEGEQQDSPTAESNNPDDASAEETGQNNLPAAASETALNTTDDQSGAPAETSTEESTDGLMGFGSGIKSFYQKNKKWIVPVGIAAVTITTIAIINHYASKPKLMAETLPQTVNGAPRAGRGNRKGGKRKDGRKTIIALM